ncbi:hypothetical protein LguiA_015797 [Lonicera macranthoides]
MMSASSFLSVPAPTTRRIIIRREADQHHQFSAPKHHLGHSSNTWSSNPRISLTKSSSPNFIPSSSSSTSTSLADEEEEEEEEEGAAAAQSESSPTLSFPLRGCKACGKEEIEQGCNGEGRIQGGIATVPGFGWWPIKAYRPCPGFVASGGRYKRQGQSMDEVAGFGRVEKVVPIGTSDEDPSR